MTMYSEKTQEKVHEVIEKMKEGKLKSGISSKNLQTRSKQ